MHPDQARATVARTPSYEYRSSGKLCTVCGAVVGNVKGDDQIHDEWHAALTTLLPPPP